MCPIYREIDVPFAIRDLVDALPFLTTPNERANLLLVPFASLRTVLVPSHHQQTTTTLPSPRGPNTMGARTCDGTLPKSRFSSTRRKFTHKTSHFR